MTLKPADTKPYAVDQFRHLWARTFCEDVRAEAVHALYLMLAKAWRERVRKDRLHWGQDDMYYIGEDAVEYVLGRFHPEADMPGISPTLKAYYEALNGKPLPDGVSPIDAREEAERFEAVTDVEDQVAEVCEAAVKVARKKDRRAKPDDRFFAIVAVQVLFTILSRFRPDLVNLRSHVKEES